MALVGGTAAVLLTLAVVGATRGRGDAGSTRHTIMYTTRDEVSPLAVTQLSVVSFDGESTTAQYNTVIEDFIDVEPVWSPDGTTIAYAAGQVFTATPDGGDIEQITDIPARVSYVSWSPDGTRLVFSTESIMVDSAIFVVDSDGSNLRQLTADDFFIRRPVWSPDGRRIAFQAQQGLSPEPHIYVVGADGSGLSNLTDGHAPINVLATWSPDGKRLAFASSFDDGREPHGIFIADVDARTIERLTKDIAFYGDRGARWSPSGTRIAFDSDRPDRPPGTEIFVMNSEGTNIVILGEGRDPVWSPDGTQLAFTSERDGDYDVYVMDADGTNTVQISDNNIDDHLPSWAPTP